MYDMLKRLYDSRRLPSTNLKNAVTLGWIKDTDYKTITGEDYTAPASK